MSSTRNGYHALCVHFPHLKDVWTNHVLEYLWPNEIQMRIYYSLVTYELMVRGWDSRQLVRKWKSWRDFPWKPAIITHNRILIHMHNSELATPPPRVLLHWNADDGSFCCATDCAYRRHQSHYSTYGFRQRNLLLRISLFNGTIREYTRETVHDKWRQDMSNRTRSQCELRYILYVSID